MVNKTVRTPHQVLEGDCLSVLVVDESRRGVERRHEDIEEFDVLEQFTVDHLFILSLRKYSIVVNVYHPTLYQRKGPTNRSLGSSFLCPREEDRRL